MITKINLTRLLEITYKPEKPLTPTTDASYLLYYMESTTSPYKAYAFEIEKLGQIERR